MAVAMVCSLLFFLFLFLFLFRDVLFNLLSLVGSHPCKSLQMPKIPKIHREEMQGPLGEMANLEPKRKKESLASMRLGTRNATDLPQPDKAPISGPWKKVDRKRRMEHRIPSWVKGESIIVST